MFYPAEITNIMITIGNDDCRACSGSLLASTFAGQCSQLSITSAMRKFEKIKFIRWTNWLGNIIDLFLAIITLSLLFRVLENRRLGAPRRNMSKDNWILWKIPRNWTELYSFGEWIAVPTWQMSGFDQSLGWTKSRKKKNRWWEIFRLGNFQGSRSDPDRSK